MPFNSRWIQGGNSPSTVFYTSVMQYNKGGVKGAMVAEEVLVTRVLLRCPWARYPTTKDYLNNNLAFMTLNNQPSLYLNFISEVKT